MKNFIADWSVFWKESWILLCKFCKKHWLGTIITILVYVLLLTLCWWYPILKNWIDERVNRIKMKIRLGRE